jgi:Ni/Co efflux regulator RcnB
MKKLISAALALALLGSAGAASAAPWGPPMRGRDFHREMVRDFPRHRVWVRGERFVAPRGGYVMVNDWHYFRLRPPPFGFHWVQAGRDFLLIGNRNGFIADVIFNPY